MINFFWMRPGSQVVELYPANSNLKLTPGTDVNTHSDFGLFSKLAKLSHHVVIGPFDADAPSWLHNPGIECNRPHDFRKMDAHVPPRVVEQVLQVAWDKLHQC